MTSLTTPAQQSAPEPEPPASALSRLRRHPVVWTLIIALLAGLVAGAIYGRSTASPWKLVGQDTFSSSTLDARWSVYHGGSENPTTKRAKTLISVNDGELQVKTLGQWGSGLCWCRNKPAQRYGRWVIRARMDAAVDHGLAMLLWPTSENWPEDGEIDISEMPRSNRSTSSFSLHWGGNNKQIHQSTPGDFTRWHTFTTEWESDHITFWIDGVQRFHTTDQVMIPHGDMFLALQTGPEMANAANVSAVLHVDWVRVYSK
jgi:hypothetical protein